MDAISVRWADNHLKTYGKRIGQLNEKFPLVLPRIVNQVGGRAKTQVVRALTSQTGLPRATIVKAIGDPGRARAGKLSYEMRTRGGNIRLKYLGPSETEEGVVAKPFGKTTLYPGAFMRAGWWPNRVDVPQWDGHVMIRVNGGWGDRIDKGRWRENHSSHGKKITFARSGVTIPYEMTQGATMAAFQGIAGPLLKVRVDAALSKLL